MTLHELMNQTAHALEAVTDSPKPEARWLMVYLLNYSLRDFLDDREVTEDEAAIIEAALKRRLAHEPLQYIIGHWEFMDHKFFVNKDVLVPRPETELLVECLLDKIDSKSVVYDLCAGSGCVGISIALERYAKVYAFEKYEGALNILQANINIHYCHNVEAIECDITHFPYFDIPPADVIVSNPPYIRHRDMAGLQPEVLCEPHTALDGGEDGLDFYRAIAENFLHCLKPGGFAAFEIGEGQAEDVIAIFHTLRHIQTIKDYNGIERVVVFGKD